MSTEIKVQKKFRKVNTYGILRSLHVIQPHPSTATGKHSSETLKIKCIIKTFNLYNMWLR